MSAEYELQLTKIIELEKKFTKDFSKDKWCEYFNLDLAIGELHSIEIDQLIKFIIDKCSSEVPGGVSIIKYVFSPLPSTSFIYKSQLQSSKN